ncbi:peptigoglycan-binding protein LysM [Stutzerimonas kirkiae]|uniref:Peptigoglycan-binding protein LysM n=1 Tax=Stutzerimonas kirkiae TaxID=2211392 RepID=A0A4V2KD24_9GAMM|nr:FimV/HubP family polar landmark protein [Stutzerimonas kirkiae]TBU97264.1 peptigoglycan-binding protein LysM [Stutzerimonas kirkiae]TBV03687.1 peptigoglycan-binding protein LysM [Stutzerimonas kirkiae]
MARVRNLVLAIAAATALTSQTTFALGLGNVELKSALNQPLAAEIELLDVQGLSAEQVVSKLASVEDFQKAGVERQGFLAGLSFTPVLREDGKSVIQVSSSRPVREPYVSFLVEVLWPSGRLLREYTLLLDPPLYQQQAAATLAPQLPVASTPLGSAPSARAVEPERPEPEPAASQGQYRTVPRDTLWQIAARNRQGGSVQQAMLAIQALNPGAFINGNINLLKAGEVLRLPSAEQITSLPQPQAIARVAEQNASWKQGRGARQLDATARSKASEAPARVATGDNLRLVAADAGKAAGAGESGADDSLQGLRDRLATTQERLDSTQRENTELGERLDDLQGQLDKLQRLMQLKDEQLAALQAQLESGAVASSKAGAGPLGNILSNAWWLIGLGGSALLLLLLVLFAWARRSRASKEVIRLEPAEVVEVTPSRPQDGTTEDPLKGAVMASDALAQADIYIAYGRFNQAAELLQSALKDEPQRTDLRLKLMEVHAELEDREGFAQEEAELDKAPGTAEQVERLKERYPSMSSFAAASAAATAAYGAVAETRESGAEDDLDIDSLDDAFDLSMDELQLDDELQPDDNASSEPLPEAEEAGEEDDLALDDAPADADFDLDDALSADSVAQAAGPSADSASTPAPAEEPVDEPENDEDAFNLEEVDSADLPEAFDLSLESDTDGAPGDIDPSSLTASLGEVDADLQELIADTAAPAADDLSEEFDFLADTDEITTKLDLARAYIDMDDADGARDILEEVIAEGNPAQQQEARDMLGGLS